MEGQELLPKSEVFQNEILARRERRDNPANEVSNPHNHGKNLAETRVVGPTANSLTLRVHDVLTRHRVTR